MKQPPRQSIPLFWIFALVLSVIPIACDESPRTLTVVPDAAPPPDAGAEIRAPADTSGTNDDAGAGDAPDSSFTAGPGDVSDTTAGPDVPVETGPGLFVEGCPPPGGAMARLIEHPDARAEGPSALGGPGDFLLANEHAVFVIQGVERIRTYYDYGGILVDELAVGGCAPTGQERFDELGLAVGRGTLDQFELADLRLFKGLEVEIVSDGSNGSPAHVRVQGTDDRFWLIEYELIRTAYLAGNPRSPSDPLGVALTLDYKLSPGSRVLEITLTVENLLSTPQAVFAGAVIFPGDTTEQFYFSRNEMRVAGYNLDLEVPWLAAAGPDGAWALGMVGHTIASAQISGVRMLLDVRPVINSTQLGPAGSGNEVRTTRLLFAVGDGDANTAVRHLHAMHPRSIYPTDHGQLRLQGETRLETDGSALERVNVDVQMRTGEGHWRTFDQLESDHDGQFEGLLPDLPVDYRLQAHKPGHPLPDPIVVRLAESDEPVVISLGDSGGLSFDIRDMHDRGLPARVTLWQGESRVARFFGIGQPETRPVPPGEYDVTVTRGYEYSFFSGPITITPGDPVALDVTLERLLDTSGFISVDTHAHATPSPDSRISLANRIATVAAEGLDVVVASDHEVIKGWQAGIDETGLHDWVATISGQEITASVPEHVNAFPLEPRLGDDYRRGDFVVWYGLDIAEIYEAGRARGAGIIQLNHPRAGCRYLCLVDYNRLTGAPELTDPTLIGLHPDAALWSWDFDTFELMNGHQDPFLNPSRQRQTGLFDDWMSFLNFGHRVTAVAVRDAHGDDIGSPITYVEVADDHPADFDQDQLVQGLLAGRALVSTGAFARVRANGIAGMGDTLVASEGVIELAVEIQALPEIDVTHFKVFVNCDEVLTVATTAPDELIKFDDVVEVPILEDSHVVVAGFGTKAQPRGFYLGTARRVPRFVTNAIYVRTDEDGRFNPPGGKTCDYSL